MTVARHMCWRQKLWDVVVVGFGGPDSGLARGFLLIFLFPVGELYDTTVLQAWMVVLRKR